MYSIFGPFTVLDALAWAVHGLTNYGITVGSLQKAAHQFHRVRRTSEEDMLKFEVKLKRVTVQTLIISVEADTAEDAEDQALEDIETHVESDDWAVRFEDTAEVVSEEDGESEPED